MKVLRWTLCRCVDADGLVTPLLNETPAVEIKRRNEAAVTLMGGEKVQAGT